MITHSHQTTTMKPFHSFQAGMIHIVYSIGKDLVDLYQCILGKPCTRQDLYRKVLMGQLSLMIFAGMILSASFAYWCHWEIDHNSIPPSLYFKAVVDLKAVIEMMEVLAIAYVVAFDCIAVLAYQRLKEV